MSTTHSAKSITNAGSFQNSGDITEDVELIEGLEETKRIATDIEARSALAKETQVGDQSCFLRSSEYRGLLKWDQVMAKLSGIVRHEA